MNSTYTREKLAALPKTDDRSKIYWRAQARKVLASHPEIETVEIVLSGNKTDSTYVKRGQDNSPVGVAVIVASTGGRYGKSRRDYLPS